LSDAAFAAGRARSLRRAGRSRRAIAAHLRAKGVPADLARAALPPDDGGDSGGDDAAGELAAALLLARRRRLGPFRAAPLPAGDPAAARREQGVLARAGFAESVVRRALACDRAEAEDLIARLRADG
jgi:regulatory protein